jgi:hypothetical protein
MKDFSQYTSQVHYSNWIRTEGEFNIINITLK